MKLLKLLTAFACGFVGCLSWQFFADCGVEPQVKKQIPTIKEIQEMVGAEPDGIIGHETLKKWDAALCNQYASQWNFYYDKK